LKKLLLHHWPSIKPLMVTVGIALILQLPWALNCYFNTGRFSLTESNFGHVLFVGLGNDRSNPWKIEYSDSFAQATVAKSGLDYSSLSFQGGDLLKRMFIDKVKQNPSAYLKCLGIRIWSTLYDPFSSVGLALNPSEKNAANQLRIRDLLMWRRFTSKVSDIITSSHSPISKARVMFSKLYALVGIGLGTAVSVLGIIGFFLSLRLGPFRLNQPLILFLGIMIVYRCGMNVALCAGEQYMTSIYLCYLPFVVNTLWYIHERWLQ